MTTRSRAEQDRQAKAEETRREADRNAAAAREAAERPRTGVEVEEGREDLVMPRPDDPTPREISEGRQSRDESETAAVVPPGTIHSLPIATHNARYGHSDAEGDTERGPGEDGD